MRIFLACMAAISLTLSAHAITLPRPMPTIPNDLPTVPDSAPSTLSGVFMLHPAGAFQSCMGWAYEPGNDPNHPGPPWSKPVIQPCQISGQFAQAYQVIVEDITAGKPWDGKTDTKVSIQNRQQQGCFTNPDEDISGVRLVYGKEVHLEPCGHPFEGRGESQRQVWEIKVDPASGNAWVATDIGSVLQGATRECLQNYGNIKPVRTPCTGEFYWQFQPVLH